MVLFLFIYLFIYVDMKYTEKLNIDANHPSQVKLKAFTFNKHR